METLWAPWRMQFIKDLRNDKGACVFCELKQKGDDRDKLILKRGKHCYTILNRYPYNSGHLMVIPYKHASSIVELSKDENSEIMTMCGNSVDILSRIVEAEGFNCGFNLGKAAGAGIADHIHMHVVPRWNGDTNFLPVLCKTRSIPEYLTDTYDRLIGEFQKL